MTFQHLKTKNTHTHAHNRNSNKNYWIFAQMRNAFDCTVQIQMEAVVASNQFKYLIKWMRCKSKENEIGKTWLMHVYFIHFLSCTWTKQQQQHTFYSNQQWHKRFKIKWFSLFTETLTLGKLLFAFATVHYWYLYHFSIRFLVLAMQCCCITFSHYCEITHQHIINEITFRLSLFDLNENISSFPVFFFVCVRSLNFSFSIFHFHFIVDVRHYHVNHFKVNTIRFSRFIAIDSHYFLCSIHVSGGKEQFNSTNFRLH